MLPHQKFTEPVPVRNGETGKVVGEAIPATIVAAHTMRNSRPYIKFNGHNVQCAFDVGNPKEIMISPGEDIGFY